MNAKEAIRQRNLIEGFFTDARSMATEAGIHECDFCQTVAMLALMELVINEHDRCVLRIMAEFFQRYIDQVDLERTADDPHKG